MDSWATVTTEGPGPLGKASSQRSQREMEKEFPSTLCPSSLILEGKLVPTKMTTTDSLVFPRTHHTFAHAILSAWKGLGNPHWEPLGGTFLF